MTIKIKESNTQPSITYQSLIEAKKSILSKSIISSIDEISLVGIDVLIENKIETMREQEDYYYYAKYINTSLIATFSNAEEYNNNRNIDYNVFWKSRTDEYYHILDRQESIEQILVENELELTLYDYIHLGIDYFYYDYNLYISDIYKELLIELCTAYKQRKDYIL